MIKCWRKLLIVIVFTSFSALCYSAPPPINGPQFLSTLRQVGIQYKIVDKQLNIYVDADTTLAVAPALAERGIFNPKTEKKQFYAHPVTFQTQIGMLYTTGIIPYIYQTTKLDELHVNVYLVYTEDDNEENTLFASFEFNRKLYDSIDWSHFGVKELSEKAPNFKFTDWYKTHIDS